ncbi:hypothetical protein FKM82_000219 [Ascaphus truei]
MKKSASIVKRIKRFLTIRNLGSFSGAQRQTPVHTTVIRIHIVHFPISLFILGKRETVLPPAHVHWELSTLIVYIKLRRGLRKVAYLNIKW